MRAEMLLAPPSCPTGARASNQDGELETWGERGYSPKTFVPPRAVGTGSILAGDGALPAPSRASTVPRARGDVGEVKGGREGDPPQAPCPGRGLLCGVGEDLRLQACGAAARPPYGSSFCSCLDSLITWRGGRGTVTRLGPTG